MPNNELQLNTTYDMRYTKPLDIIAPLTPRNTSNKIILQKQMEKLQALRKKVQYINIYIYIYIYICIYKFLFIYGYKNCTSTASYKLKSSCSINSPERRRLSTDFLQLNIQLYRSLEIK